MDFAYTFGDDSSLYLNVTNRCTNRCTFCVRNFTSHLGDGELEGDDEPQLDTLLAAVEARGPLSRFDEVVWCGFGEPTYCLPLVLEASELFARSGLAVRLNTNGHGSAIWERNVVPELAEVITAFSVSLNAPTPEQYEQLCRPISEENLWAGIHPFEVTCEFLHQAALLAEHTRATVVGHTLSPADISACQEMVARLGCELYVR